MSESDFMHLAARYWGQGFVIGFGTYFLFRVGAEFARTPARYVALRLRQLLSRPVGS